MRWSKWTSWSNTLSACRAMERIVSTVSTGNKPARQNTPAAMSVDFQGTETTVCHTAIGESLRHLQRAKLANRVTRVSVSAKKENALIIKVRACMLQPIGSALLPQGVVMEERGARSEERLVL